MQQRQALKVAFIAAAAVLIWSMVSYYTYVHSVEYRADLTTETIDCNWTYDESLAGTEYPLAYYQSNMRGVCIHEARVIAASLQDQGISVVIRLGYCECKPDTYHAWIAYWNGTHWVDNTLGLGNPTIIRKEITNVY